MSSLEEAAKKNTIRDEVHNGVLATRLINSIIQEHEC